MFQFRYRLFPLAILSVVIGQWAVLCQCNQEDDGLIDATCPLDPEVVENLFRRFRNIGKKRDALEKQLVDEGKVVQPTERIADLSHLRQTNEDSLNRDNELKQIVFEAVTDKLVEKYNLTSNQVNECLPHVPLRGEYSSKAKVKCQTAMFRSHCDASSMYRTADGTCNNLENPTWGAVGNCFVRMLPPRYVGASGFRQSAKGGPLPTPRKLSLNVHSQLDRPSSKLTHMFTFFGQLVDHEITQAPISITLNNLSIKCCVPGQLHPQCVPIPIAPTDPFYSEFGTTCMSVVRAALCPTCTLGPRQQLNQITSFIDASVMYGTNDKQTSTLRTNDGTGRMRVEKTSRGDLLPPSPDPRHDQCSYPNKNEICFLAGDPRANEHPPLASLQTIFVREHNRLADGLRTLNPSWDGEKVFQEARRIVGAEFQNMIFSEYLPITLGDEMLDRYRLRISNKRRTNYEPDTNPSIANEFTTAAFRFSHTLINSVLANYPLNRTHGKMLLRDLYFQAFELRSGILSSLMSGVTNSPAQSFDQHVELDVTDFLYRIRGQPAGLDLASINIHRGRDQGIPTYVDMMRHCSKRRLKINKFATFVRYGFMSNENARILALNYKSVEDVDLWTGILSELPVRGAVVGPTAACMIGSQFHKIKFGDRFYFEHKNQVGSFTYRQLEEIKKVTLSKLICLNTDLTHLQQEALLYSSTGNPRMKCSSVQGVNLSLWK